MRREFIHCWYGELSRRRQMRVAEDLIRLVGLQITPPELRRSILKNTLRVRFSVRENRLISSSGYKRVKDKLRLHILGAFEENQAHRPDNLLAKLSEIEPFMTHLLNGQVMEKGWAVNVGDKLAFRQLNRTVWDDLRAKGYGVDRVFNLVIDSNLPAHRVVQKWGSLQLMKLPSPYSPNTLVLSVLRQPQRVEQFPPEPVSPDEGGWLRRLLGKRFVRRSRYTS